MLSGVLVGVEGVDQRGRCIVYWLRRGWIAGREGTGGLRVMGKRRGATRALSHALEAVRPALVCPFVTTPLLITLSPNLI